MSEEKLKEWQDMQYGMFIHFGINTFAGEELPGGDTPIEVYDPTDLDVAQWISVAKEAGMKYAVLTSKHVTGHCLWPSKYTEYDIENNKDNTDVVAEFVKECRKQGIKPGIYYCAWDNHHTFGSLMPDKSENYGMALVTPTESDPAKGAPYTSHLYQNFMLAQLEEICENYGPLVQLWIDIPIILGNGYRKFLYDHFKEKYPDMMIITNHGQKKVGDKLVFLEDKAWPTDVFTLERFAPEQKYDQIWNVKGKDIYLPGEANMPIGKEWFFEDDDMPRSVDEIEAQFQACLDNNVNFLLNIPPDRSGRIPERWITPLMELKARMGDKIK